MKIQMLNLTASKLDHTIETNQPTEKRQVIRKITRLAEKHKLALAAHATVRASYLIN